MYNTFVNLVERLVFASQLINVEIGLRLVVRAFVTSI